MIDRQLGTRWRFAVVVAVLLAVFGVPVRAGGPVVSAGADQQDPADEFERLRAMLAKSGPDGKQERESAVAQLLAMPKLAAHRLVQEHLQRDEDPDGLRITILEALQRHLLGGRSAQFGGADEPLRAQILAGYLGACARFWREAPLIDDPAKAPVRVAARRALRQMPGRELDAAARAVMAAGDPEHTALVLRCLADMQQTLLATTIASQLEAPDAVVRDAARAALQLLTFAERPIRTKAEFERWYAVHGATSYVNLVERAARNGSRTHDRLRQQFEEQRVAAARDYVRVCVEHRPGVDWAAVQARTMSDGPAVLDACLTTLQEVLSQRASVEGGEAGRHAFFRVLLERFGQMPVSEQPAAQRRRALLLEVAAYLVAPSEAELVAEVRPLLLQQLAASAPEIQVSALRGLRRFPSADARAALVARARALLTDPQANRPQLQAILDTLSRRSEPRWLAPGKDDVDKQAWLLLIDECCRTDPDVDLRSRALALAQTKDAAGGRVPEAFHTLLGLVGDEALDAEFRANCLIYLEAWRSDEALAEQWLHAVLELLGDAAPRLRLQAATSLVRLSELESKRRGDWIAQALTALQPRLAAERDDRALRQMFDCVKVLGCEQEMPARAIGVLKAVLDQLGQPVPEAEQSRLELSLQALAEVASHPNANDGRWLSACEPLLQHHQRRRLRLVLRSHKAIELAKDVDSKDAEVAARARAA
ncbi:MAG TPA: hypothetical protein ENI87_13145, partial [bacterium]|nr:hypothetical protein [bacterium]